MTKRRHRSKPTPQSPASAWSKLTWDDLGAWAGERSVMRGRAYQRNGSVKQLCISSDGDLLAWVQGGDRYTTCVKLDATKRKRSDRIVSECSCPVRYACKHAVAVIVEYLQAIEDGTHVPAASETDPRPALIEGRIDGFDEDEWEDENNPKMPIPRKRTKKIGDSDIRGHLASKSPDALVDLGMQVCGRDPEIRKVLVDECALAGGRFDELLAEARSEMRSLTAEEAWRNAWTGAGHLPDYGGFKKRLKTLLDHGQADAIVQLGEEFIQRGVDQIGQSDDEGETARAIGDCMQIVYEALLQSDRSDEDKIIYAIDMVLADEYGICDSFASVRDRRWKKATWSAVADRLRSRLGDQQAVPEDRSEWFRSYQRERLSGWVMAALDNAGRTGEATELCVAEAQASDSYTRAVQRLLDAGDDDRAAELAMEGLRTTLPRYAGIIRELQDQLCEIAVKKKDWMLPASVAADRFFRRPCVSGYHDLLRAAKKTKHEQAIQSGALRFLENGIRPDAKGRGPSKQGTPPPWPLPEAPRPGVQEDKGRSECGGPHFDVLIELAIDENRPDDVLMWFDKREAAKQPPKQGWPGRAPRNDAKIAKAVEKTHPERAIEIYMRLANAIAAETNTKTYPEAGAYLKRIKPLLKKSGRAGDWPAVVGEFRAANRRKRRLMEVIDGLEGRPIIKPNHK